MSDRQATDLEALLLRAGRNEAPPADGRSRALAAALSAASAAPASAATAPSAANGSTTSRILLFGGTVCIGVCTLVLVLSSSGSDVQVTRDPVRAAGAASTATLVITDVPSAAPSATTSASSTFTAPPRGDTDQTSELDLVVSAKRSLASGAPHEALRTLDLHTARYPRGALAEEAEALRVEALVADNNPEGARAVGTAYLAKHPHGAYARRISAVIEPLPR